MQYMNWKHQLPRVSPYYAVKSNPEPYILQKLANWNIGFDCASLQEVYDVKKLYWPSESNPINIIYAHPLKSEVDIKGVNSLNVPTTVVDSIEECRKLHACGWKGSALLRVAVGDKGSQMPFSTKFGASSSEVEVICRESKIPLIGVSFHVGSGCNDNSQYVEAINYSSNYVFNILQKYKHVPSILDIGGGFSANPSEFILSAKAIRVGLLTVPAGIKVIAEPGRYFAQPSVDLFVKVIAKKAGLNDSGFRYIIDESLYGYFSCIPFDHQKPAWMRIESVPVPNQSARPMVNGVLFGRTCDSLDVIAKGVMEEYNVGDWLYFPLMGAYTNSSASCFNGFSKPYILEDTDNLLPSADTMWAVTSKFHKEHALKYSHSLPTIDS